MPSRLDCWAWSSIPHEYNQQNHECIWSHEAKSISIRLHECMAHGVGTPSEVQKIGPGVVPNEDPVPAGEDWAVSHAILHLHLVRPGQRLLNEGC